MSLCFWSLLLSDDRTVDDTNAQLSVWIMTRSKVIRSLGSVSVSWYKIRLIVHADLPFPRVVLNYKFTGGRGNVYCMKTLKKGKTKAQLLLDKTIKQSQSLGDQKLCAASHVSDPHRVPGYFIIRLSNVNLTTRIACNKNVTNKLILITEFLKITTSIPFKNKQTNKKKPPKRKTPFSMVSPKLQVFQISNLWTGHFQCL